MSVAKQRSGRNAMESILKPNSLVIHFSSWKPNRVQISVPWQKHTNLLSSGKLRHVHRTRILGTGMSWLWAKPVVATSEDHHSVPSPPVIDFSLILMSSDGTHPWSQRLSQRTLLKAFVSLMTQGWWKSYRKNTLKFVKNLKTSDDKYVSSPQSVVVSTFLTNT